MHEGLATGEDDALHACLFEEQEAAFDVVEGLDVRSGFDSVGAEVALGVAFGGDAVFYQGWDDGDVFAEEFGQGFGGFSGVGENPGDCYYSHADGDKHGVFLSVRLKMFSLDQQDENDG